MQSAENNTVPASRNTKSGCIEGQRNSGISAFAAVIRCLRHKRHATIHQQAYPHNAYSYRNRALEGALSRQQQPEGVSSKRSARGMPTSASAAAVAGSWQERRIVSRHPRHLKQNCSPAAQPRRAVWVRQSRQPHGQVVVAARKARQPSHAPLPDEDCWRRQQLWR